MHVYAVRKRAGQWAVCSDEKVVLHFDSYEQAVETARSAIGVLAKMRDEAGQKIRGRETCEPRL